MKDKILTINPKNSPLAPFTDQSKFTRGEQNE